MREMPEYKPQFSNISPSQIISGNLDQQSVWNNLQIYGPQFQLANLQKVLNIIDNNQALVPGVIANLQSHGMSYYISVAKAQAGKISSALAQTGSQAGRRGVTPNRTFRDPGGGYITVRLMVRLSLAQE